MNVNYSHSFIQYLERNQNTNKIAGILWRLLVKCSRRYNFESAILTTGELNHLTFRNDGEISYLPAGKEFKRNANGGWSREGRQSGKPAKVIRKLFHPRFLRYLTDKDFENFANNYKAESTKNGYTFELWGAKEIEKAYGMERIESGRLAGSCMNGDISYMGIYHNCDRLHVLVLLDKDGRLNGRALVWNVSDSMTFMDRIYTAGDHLDDMFFEYAEKHKWYRKVRYNTFEEKTKLIDPNGKVVYETMTINTPTDFPSYPYIDTFSYGNDGTLTNDPYGTKYEYDGTTGKRTTKRQEEQEDDDHSGQTYDEINDCWIDEDEAVFIEHGERRYRQRTTSRDNCVRVNNSWYHEDDVNIVELNGTWYSKDDDDVVQLRNGDFALMGDAVECQTDGEWYEQDDDDVVEIDDEWYRKDDDDVVEINDVYYLKDSDDVIEINDEYHLKDDCVLCELDGNYYLPDDVIYSEYLEMDIPKIKAYQVNGDWLYQPNTPQLVKVRK